MKVKAIQCPKCLDIIYSRFRHDMRSCSCGLASIDGGFDYVRILYFKSWMPKIFELDVNTTKKELFKDWNEGIDKFGVIKIEGVYDE